MHRRAAGSARAADWALGDLGVAEVLGVVAAGNRPSCRVLEKAGFARAGEDATGVRIYRRGA